ncbi:MAG: SPW repeat protein [Candidatus Pacebacteria bacterium]|nr:SPW repeat protein [Candidatus Paceibacterota bacterium]
MKWINQGQLILGLWILASPWILGFSFANSALWNNVIIGTLLIILSLREILEEN